MKGLSALAGALVLATALSASAHTGNLGGAAAGTQVTAPRLPPAAAAGEIVLYGHVRGVTRTGGRFVMRFDPAWWLGGVAAEQAAVEDGAIRAGEPVPNDYYVVDEGHRLLTYVVAPVARVTVLTRDRPVTRITVSELWRIVAGGNPRHRRLLQPKAGFWIRVGPRYPNPVLSLDQQYQP